MVEIKAFDAKAGIFWQNLSKHILLLLSSLQRQPVTSHGIENIQ